MFCGFKSSIHFGITLQIKESHVTSLCEKLHFEPCKMHSFSAEAFLEIGFSINCFEANMLNSESLGALSSKPAVCIICVCVFYAASRLCAWSCLVLVQWITHQRLLDSSVLHRSEIQYSSKRGTKCNSVFTYFITYRAGMLWLCSRPFAEREVCIQLFCIHVTSIEDHTTTFLTLVCYIAFFFLKRHTSRISRAIFMNSLNAWRRLLGSI